MYVPVTRKLADNPWFWVALFGGVGLLGVIVIGPKFAARWSRVERMQETRERIALERAQKEAKRPAAVNSQLPPVATASSTGAATSTGEPATLPEREPYVEGDFEQPTSLRYLLLLMMLVMVVGTSGLIVTRGRERRAVEQAEAEAANSLPAASPPPPQA